jgi:hypothetical protein
MMSDWDAVDRLLIKGLYVQAVKEFRAQKQCGLKEAKEAVDARRALAAFHFIDIKKKEMSDCIYHICLAWKMFESTDDEIRECFRLAAERCLEYKEEIIGLVDRLHNVEGNR